MTPFEYLEIFRENLESQCKYAKQNGFSEHEIVMILSSVLSNHEKARNKEESIIRKREENAD